MRFFITAQDLASHASMKRSLGMAPVLFARGHGVTVLMQEHPENRKSIFNIVGVSFVFFPSNALSGCYCASSAYDVIIYNSLGWRNAVFEKRGGTRVILDSWFRNDF